MSSEPLEVEEVRSGTTFYTALSLAALAVAAVPLLARGFGPWALFPSLGGLLAVLFGWRVGPGLFLFNLLWLAVADRLRFSPWGLLSYVLDLVTHWLMRSPRPLYGPLPDWPWSLFGGAEPLLDMLLAAAVVFYVACHSRLLAVTTNLFPVERKRRERGPVEGGGRLALAPEPPQKRSAAVVEPAEAAPLLVAALTAACLAEFLWLWLSVRDPAADLASLIHLGAAINIHPGLWRLLVLAWVAFVVLVPLTGLLAYLGQLRLTAAEAGLYLQDQLWRQTRREQARVNRWLAWASRRERRRARK